MDNQYNSPCWGCTVGEYCDYDPKWCRDNAVSKVATDDMYEPSNCANWRHRGGMVIKKKTA